MRNSLDLFTDSIFTILNCNAQNRSNIPTILPDRGMLKIYLSNSPRKQKNNKYVKDGSIYLNITAV